MTPQTEVLTKFFEFAGALSLLTSAMTWWRKGGQAEDDMMVEATNVVLDSLADADTVGKIDAVTGRDLRDQLTVAEAEEMHRERELRGFWRRN